MAMVINSNIMSLNAQRNLMISQGDQNQAMERLSSGKRINSAADDAAGLAISNRMTSQVRGLDQAIRNANDGISLIQTAEGALDETTNILQRMRELSIQSANGTYDDGNRSTLNAEVQQLISEIDRISETTKFNGLNILDGTLGDVDLQAGADAYETISLSIGEMSADGLGSGQGADIVGDLSAATSTGNAGSSLFDNLTAFVGGTATSTTTTTTTTVTGGTAVNINTNTNTNTNDHNMYINGQSVGDLTALTAADNSLQDVLDTINTNISGVEAGAVVSWTANTAGDGVLQGTEGLQIQVTKLDTLDTDIGTSVEVINIQNTGSMDELVAAINEQANGLVEASVDEDGLLTVSSTGAAQIEMYVSSDITTGTLAAGTAALGTSALGMTSAATGAVTQAAQLTLTAEAGTDGVEVTYDVVGDAGRTGIDSRYDSGVISGYAAITTGTGTGNDIGLGEVVLNGVALSNYDASLDYDDSGTAGEANDVVSWINSHKDETGVVASVATVTGVGGTAVTDVLTLTSTDGGEISLTYDETNKESIENVLGLSQSNGVDNFGSSVSDINISTAGGAQKAIEVIDDALEQINSTRGDLGAVNNRLDFTVNNLSNVSENVAAARSRIEDADFAAESAALSRAQVLQQAGTAMLAQANAAPQQVLSLLQ
ncbi:MAG: flagellin [Neptuniibacter sp.]